MSDSKTILCLSISTPKTSFILFTISFVVTEPKSLPFFPALEVIFIIFSFMISAISSAFDFSSSFLCSFEDFSLKSSVSDCDVASLAKFFEPLNKDNFKKIFRIIENYSSESKKENEPKNKILEIIASTLKFIKLFREAVCEKQKKKYEIKLDD